LTSNAAAWVSAFTITVAVELLVAIPILGKGVAGWKRRAGLVFFANLASHPAVWFVFPEWIASNPLRLCFSEIWAVSVEATLYALVWPALGAQRAFGASAIANGASLAAGLALRALGVPI
jgi:hypothetical protein